jgi:hypothetical protein
LIDFLHEVVEVLYSLNVGVFISYNIVCMMSSVYTRKTFELFHFIDFSLHDVVEGLYSLNLGVLISYKI